MHCLHSVQDAQVLSTAPCRRRLTLSFRPAFFPSIQIQKQILLGDAACGKSSLLVRLTDDRFLQHSEPSAFAVLFVSASPVRVDTRCPCQGSMYPLRARELFGDDER